FGHRTAAGVYTILARNPVTQCVSNMGGSATIVINALPAIDTVTGGGSFCAGGAGRHVELSNSTTGINYQLYRDGVAVGGVAPGINAELDFGLYIVAGTYKVTATNFVTTCMSNMLDSAVIAINPLPLVYAT